MATVVVTLVIVILTGLVQSVDCDCNQKYIVRPGEDFIITSPNYPGNFTQHADCYYELSTSSQDVGAVVYVDVLDVSLKCDDTLSQLSVYDGFSRRPRLLGRVCVGGQETFESPKYTLYLTFRTRALHRSRGFKLRVRAEPKFSHCYSQTTQVLEVTSTPAIITSPFYPYETDANVNCRWLLKAPQGYAINATLLAADMRGSRLCKNFGLFVYDGKTTYDDRLIAAVCDSSVRQFQSSGPYMLVVFTSGAMVFHSGGGIKLQYTTITLDNEERQMIGQTLFFVITALLMVIIVSVTLIAALKLVLLPRRRKQAERRRRQTRARLTRVSSVMDSQSDLLPPYSAEQQRCSRVSSCGSLTSCESVNGAAMATDRRRPVARSASSSLRELFSKYGLKSFKRSRESRRERERQRAPERAVPVCGYRRDNREIVVLGLPGLPPFAGVPEYDLPPSYEEATAHPAGLPVIGDSEPLDAPQSEEQPVPSTAAVPS